MAKLLTTIEHALKKPVWDCRMCGQCVLHSTGLTCPMTCPKTLRNGPCGGVREDGACEVRPEMTCVWLKAQRRSEHMPRHWREEFDELRPPVDNRLHGTSSWVNLFTGRDRATPPGWSEGAEHGPGSGAADGAESGTGPAPGADAGAEAPAPAPAAAS